VNKKDRKVKFVSLSTAAMPTEWATAYKQYTGMTMPMFEGTAIAKRLNVGFVPAVVVVTPNNKKAYLKTGQQSFQRLYEFVRTAQGAPIALSPEAEHVQAQTIGYEERRANPRGKAPGPELQRIGTEGSQARPVTASKNELGKF
jgi:hypothetical protein